MGWGEEGRSSAERVGLAEGGKAEEGGECDGGGEGMMMVADGCVVGACF